MRATTIQSSSMIGWLYTGPLGHLAAGVIDWVVLLVRYLRAR
jgi:hypothetical protein